MFFGRDDTFHDLGECLKTQDLEKILLAPSFVSGFQAGNRKLLTYLFEELQNLTSLAFGISTETVKATPKVTKAAVFCLTNHAPQFSAQLASSRPFLRQMNQLISTEPVPRNVATVFCSVLEFLIQVSNGFVLVHFPERTMLFGKLLNHIGNLAVYEFLHAFTYSGQQYLVDFLTQIDASNLLLNALGNDPVVNERVQMCLSNCISVSMKKNKLTEPFKQPEVLEKVLGFCWNSGSESVATAAFRLLTCVFNHSYETGSDSDLIKIVYLHVSALCNYIKSGEKFTKSRALGVLILIRVLVFRAGELPYDVYYLLDALLQRFLKEKQHTFVHSSFYELLKVAITKDPGVVKRLKLKEMVLELYKQRDHTLASYWGFLHRIVGLIVRWRGFETYEVDGWDTFVRDVYDKDEQMYMSQYGGALPGVKSLDEITFDNFPSFRKSESSDDDSLHVKPIVSQPQFTRINLLQTEPLPQCSDTYDEEESEHDYEDFESEVQEPEIQGNVIKWIMQKLIPDDRIKASVKLDVTVVLATDSVCDKLLFSPQDERVAMICWHKVEVFDIGERHILVYSHAFACRIAAAAFRGVDSMVFFITGERNLYFVNLVTEVIETVEFVAADYVAFSDDGQLIACICHNDIKVYNVETQELVGPVFSDPHLSGSFCTFSPNGMYLGVCYRGGQMRVFSLKDGTKMIDVKPMQNVATSIAVSNTGTTFVTGSSDTTVTIWELADNTLQWRTLRGHKGSVSALTMDAKQQWVVSGGQDSNINISSMSTEEMVYSVSAHTGFVSALAFGHIGLKFASTSEDCLVKVWSMVEVPCETTL